MISLNRRIAMIELCSRGISWRQHRCHSSIRSLQNAFRDPTSPFHIAPGTQESGVGEDIDAAVEARTKLLEMGYDPTSFWEQRIVWGDHDSFQHVNNVRYVRFFESSRIEWMVALGRALGGSARAEAMLGGREVSLILKSLSIDYKRPVVYPDTLLVAHAPHAGVGRGPNAQLPKTHFGLRGAMWSYKQRRIVTDCDSVIVWYDYDRLAKCDPGEEARALLLQKMQA
ncbi:Thioesterase/thiol ester dehydrase-isomerase [Amylocystis lapponica]|nr:Thioesterase/thiol ester dehydrase-isomerase [Amylocystis lapponica]